MNTKFFKNVNEILIRKADEVSNFMWAAFFYIHFTPKPSVKVLLYSSVKSVYVPGKVIKFKK